MPTEKEKLSILSEMISFAKVNNEIKESEYDFLFSVAQQLNVTKKTFDKLFTTNVEHVIPKSQSDRLLQFHRLVLLMNVDDKQDDEDGVSVIIRDQFTNEVIWVYNFPYQEDE